MEEKWVRIEFDADNYQDFDINAELEPLKIEYPIIYGFKTPETHKIGQICDKN